MSILLQMMLDAWLMFVCGSMMFREKKQVCAKDLTLLPILAVFCMAARADYIVGRDAPNIFIENGFDIAPANNIYLFLFFILALLLLNSTYYKSDSSEYAFCGSAAEVSIYLILRISAALLLSSAGITGDLLSFAIRFLALAAAGLLYLSPAPESLQRTVKDGGIFAVLISGDILIVTGTVLALQSLDYAWITRYSREIALMIPLLIAINAILILMNRHRVEEKKYVRMIEQYVPIVEELVTQVRSRQHDYNNRFLAIEAAVSTASTLEEAQQAVSELKGGLVLDTSERELLSCDSKIIAGLIYEKTRQVERAGIMIRTELRCEFKKAATQESEWIELLGIFLDNAIEASVSGDIIYIRSKQKEHQIELVVENPAPPISNTEAAALFRRGVSSKKGKDGHGFGLYNALKIAELRHGKIITRNTDHNGQNYVVFGVLMP